MAIDGIASANGFGLVDQSGMKVGIDCHLSTWESVEHESGGHFADPSRAFGDHDELNDHHNAEHDGTDDDIVASDKRPERFDDIASGIEPLGSTIKQDQTGTGDIQDKPSQSGG